MPRLPEIENLRSIAENALLEPGSRPRSSLREVIPHDAQSLFQLVKTSSLAVTEPRSQKREKFVEYFNACQRWDADFEYNGKLLNDKLWDMMQLVDELFFFHTLTRGTKGPHGREGLVSLRVDSAPSDPLASRFRKLERQITVYLYPTPGGERHEFKYLLYFLMHEMCHAFLDFFSDQSHPNHHEWVGADRGHGSLFWRLLRFLVEAVMDITQSPVWKFGFDRWTVEYRESMERMAGTSGGFPSGGSPGFPPMSSLGFPPTGSPRFPPGGSSGFPPGGSRSPPKFPCYNEDYPFY